MRLICFTCNLRNLNQQRIRLQCTVVINVDGKLNRFGQKVIAMLAEESRGASATVAINTTNHLEFLRTPADRSEWQSKARSLVT